MELQGEEVFQQALWPSKGSTIESGQASHQGSGPRLQQPVCGPVKSIFELLYGIALNDICQK